MPERKKTGVLGTPVDEIRELNKKYMGDAGNFEKRASDIQLKRGVTGESSIICKCSHLTTQKSSLF